MYLPSCTYSSKSDFGSITSPFLMENGTALLDHSTPSARRLSEYRDYCSHEPRQQHPPPDKWTLYPARRPITSPPPACFNLPGEAVYGGAVYGASGSRFQAQVFAGDPLSLPGGYTAFNPDSQLLFQAGRSSILSPGFDRFFEHAEEGMDAKVEISPGSQQETKVKQAEWTSCHSGDSSEVRAGSQSPEAGKEDEEDAPSSSGGRGDCSHAPSESLHNKHNHRILIKRRIT